MVTLSNKLHNVLRVACAMCFIGHGAFGLITKQIWCNYFGVFGIGEQTSYQLMPWVGMLDIAMGVLMIVYPLRFVAMWLVCWGFITALLRPLSGEFFAEFLERAGNYGAPLLLLLFSSDRSFKNYFRRIEPSETLDQRDLEKFTKWVQGIACTLLVGHGWLNLIGKAGLIKQYVALGFQQPALAAQIVGVWEILAAVMIAVKPVRQLVMVIFIWKMGSELFYPAHELFEWVERGGSYGVLLVLWFVLKEKPSLLSLRNNFQPVTGG